MLVTSLGGETAAMRSGQSARVERRLAVLRETPWSDHAKQTFAFGRLGPHELHVKETRAMPFP